MRHLLNEMGVGDGTNNTWEKYVELWDGSHMLKLLLKKVLITFEVSSSKKLIHESMSVMRYLDGIE